MKGITEPYGNIPALQATISNLTGENDALRAKLHAFITENEKLCREALAGKDKSAGLQERQVVALETIGEQLEELCDIIHKKGRS